MHKIQTSLFSLLGVALITITLSACGGTGGGYSAKKIPPKQASAPAVQEPDTLSDQSANAEPQIAGEAAPIEGAQPIKVAILLPLSGQHESLGQSMLQAAQLAMFDIGFDNFELVPKDTAGTPEGASSAAQSALQDGAKLILGPIFSNEVKAAQIVTQGADVNMIAFSTDWTLANDHTYLIGFLPFDQVDRVTSYAKNSGLNNIGVLSPADNYGDGVVSAYRAIAGNLGLGSSRITRFAANGTDLPAAIAQFSATNQPYNAVLMPVGGAMARQLGSSLTTANMPAQSVRRLGTGLMDDPVLATDQNLSGLWFAAPEPSARKKFERRFFETYSAPPQRIASLAYDATALAAVLARKGFKVNGRAAFGAPDITNPNGFAGVDGIFRFRTDGIVERGLAVLEFKGGRIVVIDKAPQTFQKTAY